MNTRSASPKATSNTSIRSASPDLMASDDGDSYESVVEGTECETVLPASILLDLCNYSNKNSSDHPDNPYSVQESSDEDDPVEEIKTIQDEFNETKRLLSNSRKKIARMHEKEQNMRGKAKTLKL